MGFAPTGYLTVNDAADKLGNTPADVHALVQTGAVEAVTLISAESLSKYEQESA